MHPHKNKTAINIEYLNASIRAKIRQPFRIIRCQFCFIKARCKELAKNDKRLAMLSTLANLFKVNQMLRRQPKSDWDPEIASNSAYSGDMSNEIANNSSKISQMTQWFNFLLN